MRKGQLNRDCLKATFQDRTYRTFRWVFRLWLFPRGGAGPVVYPGKDIITDTIIIEKDHF